MCVRSIESHSEVEKLRWLEMYSFERKQTLEAENARARARNKIEI